MFKTIKGSVIILIILILLIAGFGRLFKLLDVRTAEAQTYRQEKDVREKQLEEVKKENEELKVEVQSPLAGKILQEIKRVFGETADEAIAIISCENNPHKPDYDPFRININKNNTLDYGVFQINSLWERVYGGEFKKDWKANVKVAKAIFDRSGTWRHWYSSNNCHHLAYVN